MNTLSNDLVNLIDPKLDASESNLIGIQIDMVNVEEAVRTKNMKFILYYTKSAQHKYDLIEFATYYQYPEFINLIYNIDENQNHLAITKAYVRSNDLEILKQRLEFNTYKDMMYTINQLMITAINCKNRSMIKYFKSNYWFFKTAWCPVEFEPVSLLKLNYDGDVNLLDLVFTDLVVDTDYDIDANEHVVIYFDNWGLGLDIMLQKGDHVCAEYFRQKLR